jgi:hypothetical protein
MDKKDLKKVTKESDFFLVVNACKPLFGLHRLSCKTIDDKVYYEVPEGGKENTLNKYKLDEKDRKLIGDEVRKILSFRILFNLRTTGGRDIALRHKGGSVYLYSINDRLQSVEKKPVSDTMLRKWFGNRGVNDFLKRNFTRYYNESPRKTLQKLCELESALEIVIGRVNRDYIYMAHDVVQRLYKRLMDH